MRSKINIYLIIAVLALGMFLGWLFFSGDSREKKQLSATKKNVEKKIWTCAMHPHIRRQRPGKCPICGMDLVPLNAEDPEEGLNQIEMSSRSMALAQVRTVVVSKNRPTKEIFLSGKVQPDQRRIYVQTSHVSGRIEKLLVNYIGARLKKGQVFAYVYSPELVTTQKELFEAYKIRKSQPEFFNAAYEKLRNWKLTSRQIDRLLASGRPQEVFPILSDYDGVVLDQKVNLGDHVETGAPFFQLADLSRVWVLLDVYESDISWVKIGDQAQLTVEAFPDQSFYGKINFIDPTMDPRTRVARARIEVNNSKGLLKPEMLVKAALRSKARTEETVLTVPKSAVLWTGRRSVVYVKRMSLPSGASFEMRTVDLGPSLGATYVIEKGLEEGEEVVAQGAFAVDAAAQLSDKPSMMRLEK